MYRRIWRICGLAAVTVLFIFGNRLAAEGLFKNMEHRLLSDMGNLKLETAVELADVQTTDYETTTDTSSAVSESESIYQTELTMAKIITCWKYSGGEVVHEPMEGQLSMEEAIEMARLWIYKMLESGSLPQILYNLRSDTGEELMFDSVVAALFASYTNYENIRYSSWNVTFICKYGSIELRLNAVTGEVWNADITIVGEPEDIYMQIEKEDLKMFGQLAGMKGGFFYDSEMTVLGGDTGLIYVTGSVDFDENNSYGFDYEEEALAYGLEVLCCKLQYVLCAADDESLNYSMAVTE